MAESPHKPIESEIHVILCVAWARPQRNHRRYLRLQQMVRFALDLFSVVAVWLDGQDLLGNRFALVLHLFRVPATTRRESYGVGQDSPCAVPFVGPRLRRGVIVPSPSIRPAMYAASTGERLAPSDMAYASLTLVGG